MAKKTLALAFLFFPIFLSAQTIKDSVLNLSMFSFHMSGNIPAGDIAKRYGLNAGAGGSYILKTKKNWLFSAEFTALYSNKLKQKDVISGLVDPNGCFITINGDEQFPTISERGFYTGLRLGKVLPVFGPNKNSGLMITASGGLLQYKTFYRQEEHTIPIIMDDYAKLIDYLTNGFAMNEFVGYLHLDNERPINFYVGLEFHQAWTKCRRDWLYDLHGPENINRHDFLFGIRAAWLFPIGKKTTGSYTYF